MKKILLLSAFAGIVFFSNAQGFSSFTVEGSLQPASIKNVVKTNSLIEVLVGENTDLKNVNFKYRLLGGCSLENNLNKDFTQPQKVTVLKNDGSSKEWLIQVKKLRPATVPVKLAFSESNPSVWTPETSGWAGIGIDAEKTTVIRFGNNGVSFWMAFDKPATKLAYQLKMVSREAVSFDGEFLVETSADGKSWNTLACYNESNKLTAEGNYNHNISKDVRFIRWTYAVRNKLNLNLNNISIAAE